ncbi:hypothetical protein VTL71DRAFT_15805 [Oculimacula yallundae]|uniref:Uncharacterized protein n=1 Tax=Oculimacula yallundae TaxID=86028 RepID=A0ABR4CCR3_9HELO
MTSICRAVCDNPQCAIHLLMEQEFRDRRAEVLKFRLIDNMKAFKAMETTFNSLLP